MSYWTELPQHLESRIVSEISTKAKIQAWKPKKLKTDTKICVKQEKLNSEPLNNDCYQSLVFDICKKVSTNKIYESKHWGVRDKLKNEFINYYFNLLNKFTPVINYPIKITYDFYFVRNPLDTLNCCYMAKMMEDIMVKLGVIVDDSPKYVKQSVITSSKSNINQVRITISLV